MINFFINGYKLDFVKGGEENTQKKTVWMKQAYSKCSFIKTTAHKNDNLFKKAF